MVFLKTAQRQQVTELNAISKLHCKTWTKQRTGIQYRLLYKSSNYSTVNLSFHWDKMIYQKPSLQ